MIILEKTLYSVILIFYKVKFNKNTTRMIKDIAIMEIRNLINSDNTQLVNTDDFLESAEKSSNILEMFFIL